MSGDSWDVDKVTALFSQVCQIGTHGNGILASFFDPEEFKEAIYPSKNESPTLAPLPTPPNPTDNPVAFEHFFKTQMVSWFYDFLLENGQFDDNRYSRNLVERINKETDLAEKINLQFRAITGDTISDNQLQKKHVKPPPREEWTVPVILAYWRWVKRTASLPGMVRGVYGGTESKERAFIQDVPYPIGSMRDAGDPTTDDDTSDAAQGHNISYFYRYPMIIVALYINNFIKLKSLGKLRADAPEHGLTMDEFHWSKANTSSFSMVCVVGNSNIIGENRLTALANSVVKGYHHIIIDDTVVFTTEKGEKISMGLLWILKRMHACHLLCHREEKLSSGTLACYCMSLSHLIAADVEVNVKNHEQCPARELTITYDAKGSERRTLRNFCECCNHEGNPSNALCRKTLTITPDTQDKYRVASEVVGKCVIVSYEAQQPIMSQMDKKPRTIASNTPDDSAVHTSVLLPNVYNNGTHIDPKRYVLFGGDTETSGLSIEDDRVLELGVALVASSVDGTDEYRAYVCPDGDYIIQPGATNVNGLTKSKLRGFKGTAEEIQNSMEFLSSKKNGRDLVLIGHNIKAFDLPLIRAEMRRCNLDTSLLTNVCTHYIDTLAIAKDSDVWEDIDYAIPTPQFPDDKPFKLENLYRYLFKDELPDAHSALGDVDGCLAILFKLDPDLKFAKKHMKPISS